METTIDGNHDLGIVAFPAPLFERHFEDSRFILSIRNPYEVCEGVRRKEGYGLAAGSGARGLHRLDCVPGAESAAWVGELAKLGVGHVALPPLSSAPSLGLNNDCWNQAGSQLGGT